MKKTATKALSLFLVMCMTLSLLCITSFAATETPYTSFTYSLGTSTITLTDYIGTDAEVVVPGTYTIDGTTYNVVLDSQSVFIGNKTVTSITLKSGIKFLGNTMRELFDTCSNLLTVDISEISTEGVTDMSYMFYHCTKLTALDVSNFDTSKVTTIKGIFNSVESANITGFENFDTSSLTIMDFAFNRTLSQQKVDMSKWDMSKIISNRVCFQSCHATDFLFPESLPIICEGFLNHATDYNKAVFTIPAGVKKIGYVHTFYEFGTGAFNEYKVAEGNTNYVAIDGSLYTKDLTEMLAIPIAKKYDDGIFELPEGVKFMGELSFTKNPYPKKLIIPDSYEFIDYVPLNDDRYKCGPYDEGNINNGNSLSISTYLYSGVAEYEVKETNPNYVTVDGVMYSKDMKTLLAVPPKYNRFLNIPEGVEVWDRYAIWTIDELKKYMSYGGGVYVPASMHTIGTYQKQFINALVDSYGYTITVDPGNTVFGINASGHIVPIDQAGNPTEVELVLKNPVGNDTNTYHIKAGSTAMFKKPVAGSYTLKYTHNGQTVEPMATPSNMTMFGTVLLPSVAGPNVYTAQLWNGETMVVESPAVSLYGATIELLEGTEASSVINSTRFTTDTAYKALLAEEDPIAIALYEATKNESTGVYESDKTVYTSKADAASSKFRKGVTITDGMYADSTGKDITCIDFNFFLSSDGLENTPSSYLTSTYTGAIAFFSTNSSSAHTYFSKLFVNGSNQLVAYSKNDPVANTGITLTPGNWYNITGYLDHDTGTTDFYIDGILMVKDYFVGGSAPIAEYNRAYVPYKASNGFYDQYKWNDTTTFVKDPSLAIEIADDSAGTITVAATDFEEFIESGYEIRTFVNDVAVGDPIDFGGASSTTVKVGVEEIARFAKVTVAPVAPDGTILNAIYGPAVSNEIIMTLVPDGYSEDDDVITIVPDPNAPAVSLSLKHATGDDAVSYHVKAGTNVMFNPVTAEGYTVKYTHNGKLVTPVDISSEFTVSNAVVLPSVEGPNVYTVQLWNGDTAVYQSESVNVYGATMELLSNGAVSNAIIAERFSTDTTYRALLASGDATAIALYEATLNSETGEYESGKAVYNSRATAANSTNKIQRNVTDATYADSTGRDLTAIDFRFFLSSSGLENAPSSFSAGEVKGNLLFFSTKDDNVYTKSIKLYLNPSDQLVIYSTSDGTVNTGVTIKPGIWYDMTGYLDVATGTADFYAGGMLIAKDISIGTPVVTYNRAFMPYKASNGFFERYTWNDYTTFVYEPKLAIAQSSGNTITVTATDFDEFLASRYKVRAFVNGEAVSEAVDFGYETTTTFTFDPSVNLENAEIYVAPVTDDGKLLNGLYGPVKSNVLTVSLAAGEYSMAASNVAVSGTKATFDLAFTSNLEMKGKAYVAVYEGNKLVALQDYTASTTGADVSVDYAAGQTIKVFWWDENLDPLCQLLDINVGS